ncbi:MAG TPA: DNA polymerase III subunit delta [Chthoniobacterales bacterium]
MPPKGKSTTATATASAIYAVVGNDESEVKRVARDLSLKLAPKDAGEFGIEIIDGAAENADQARQRIAQTIDALLTFPFFGGGKLVWLKNASFLADNVAGRAESVIEAVEALAQKLQAGLAPDVTFLLSAPDIDKRRSFYKILGKIANLQVLDKIDTSRGNWEELVEGVIVAESRKTGLRFERDALELFVQLTGADTRQISNELEKLDLFLGKKRVVDHDTVRLLVAQTREGVVFELGNVLARRDLRESLLLVDQLLRQGETAIGILFAAIIPTVRNLLVAKDLMVRHKLRPPDNPFNFARTLERLPQDAIRHLPRKKDGSVNTFSLGFAAQGAAKYQLPELEDALKACLEANQKMVTTQLDPALILTQLIVRIAGGKNRS